MFWKIIPKVFVMSLMSRFSTYAAALSGVVTTPALTTAQTAPGLRVTTGLQVDSHLSAGQTDKFGDRKVIGGAARLANGLTFGVEAGIVTPQFTVHNQSRDTASIIGTVGYESDYQKSKPQIGFYASVGSVNGAILRAAHNIVTAMHGTKARSSAASSGRRFAAGVAGRFDIGETLAEGAFENVALNASSFAIARTDKVSIGSALFASYNMGKDAHFRPDIPGMPLDSQKSDLSIYGGAIIEGRAYDLPTHHLNTNFLKATCVGGLSASLKRFTLGGEIQHDLSDDVHRGRGKPVTRYVAKLGVNF
ncbi:MAG: hypothetical protein DI551_08925 [Micavibrio aeruginosavorus]|uniref:Porin domain-containing protein n=1 Tax=Micavibrio aeruginosavorus TaxID=349221 RepID=A0A2W5PR33_9BACT|nr:MAG: hypothetical protein DI551_08925 [Micavibrio aeruginosavorus]